jgi:hypothetical protein
MPEREIQPAWSKDAEDSTAAVYSPTSSRLESFTSRHRSERRPSRYSSGKLRSSLLRSSLQRGWFDVAGATEGSNSIVRVRWFDHRYKVTSDTFDRVQKRTGGEVSISGCGVAAGPHSRSSAILQPRVPKATGQGISIWASAPYRATMIEKKIRRDCKEYA